MAGRWAEMWARSFRVARCVIRRESMMRSTESRPCLAGQQQRRWLCSRQGAGSYESAEAAVKSDAGQSAPAVGNGASASSKKASSGGGFTLTRFFLVSAGVGCAGLGAMYLVRPESTKQMIEEAAEQVDSSIKYFTEPSRDQFLPDPIPMYPGGPPMRTLVLDFDETMVYSTWTRQSGWKVAKRPGLEAFLAYMSSFYEIVVFTSGLNTYADPILDKLDPNGYVMHRLYRDSTKYEDGVHVFDLSKLNRELENVILIDSHVEHAKYQPDNLLLVPSWKANPKDRALLDLIPLLESLVREETRDVRPVVSSYAGTNIAEEFQRRKAIAAEDAASSGWGGGFSSHGGGGGSAPPAEKLKPPPGSLWGRMRSEK